MNKKHFNRLVESMTQMDEIIENRIIRPLMKTYEVASTTNRFIITGHLSVVEGTAMFRDEHETLTAYVPAHHLLLITELGIL